MAHLSSVRLQEGFTRADREFMDRRRLTFHNAMKTARNQLDSIHCVRTGEYENGTKWVLYTGLNTFGFSASILVNEVQSK